MAEKLCVSTKWKTASRWRHREYLHSEGPIIRSHKSGRRPTSRSWPAHRSRTEAADPGLLPPGDSKEWPRCCRLPIRWCLTPCRGAMPCGALYEQRLAGLALPCRPYRVRATDRAATVREAVRFAPAAGSAKLENYAHGRFPDYLSRKRFRRLVPGRGPDRRYGRARRSGQRLYGDQAQRIRRLGNPAARTRHPLQGHRPSEHLPSAADPAKLPGEGSRARGRLRAGTGGSHHCRR